MINSHLHFIFVRFHDGLRVFFKRHFDHEYVEWIFTFEETGVALVTWQRLAQIKIGSFRCSLAGLTNPPTTSSAELLLLPPYRKLKTDQGQVGPVRMYATGASKICWEQIQNKCKTEEKRFWKTLRWAFWNDWKASIYWCRVTRINSCVTVTACRRPQKYRTSFSRCGKW